VAEDNRADEFLIRESIVRVKLKAEVHIVRDGEKAIRFFEQADTDESAPCPSLVILDLNLPKKHGREVLLQLRQSRRCAGALVLIVTSSDLERDRTEMKQLGAHDYFCKPSKYEDYMKLGDVVKRLLEGRPEEGSL